jgi:hypothetical protein
MDAQRNRSWIVVDNVRQWIGDPRLAGFAVYVDGVRAGLAQLGESITAPVAPGRHSVRIRGWWFLSPRVDVVLKAGEAARFSADISRETPVWRRIARAIVDPFHSLSLAKQDQVGSEERDRSR